MRMIVVGGQARDIGKTSVICAMLRELREMDWTAVKITGYGVQESSMYGGSPSIMEERHRGTNTDTSRYLAAGARRSFWLRVPAGHFADAMALFDEATRDAPAAIVESNRIMEFVDPNAYVLLLDPARKEYKESARRFFGRASAYAIWPPATLRMTGKPVFELKRDCHAPPGMMDFIRDRLKEDR